MYGNNLQVFPHGAPTAKGIGEMQAYPAGPKEMLVIEAKLNLSRYYLISPVHKEEG